MRIVKICFISVALISLGACSTVQEHGFLKDESQSYRKETLVEQTVIIPQNLSAKNVQDYYEVPRPDQEVQYSQPPITPPGSNLNQAPANQAFLSQQEKIRNAESAKIQGHTSPTNNNAKPIGVNFSQAWVKVGHILQASNYKIMDKDNSIGTYFVIDTSKTNGAMKKDMPIYQVHLKPSGNGTLISVNPRNSALQAKINQALND